MKKNLLLIGHVAKAHGIKGELSLNYYADNVELLNKRIWLGRDIEHLSEISLSSYRFNNDKIIISIGIIKDRTEAEKYKSFGLYIETDDLPKLSEDELYVHQLINLSVYTLKGTSEEHLGKIHDVIFPAGQELWQILSLDNKELLFPAVDEFVVDIDLEKKKVIIDPPLGLFE